MTGFSISVKSIAYRGAFQPEYTSKNRESSEGYLRSLRKVTVGINLKWSRAPKFYIFVINITCG